MMQVTVLIDKREKKPLLFPSNIKWYPNRGGRGQLVVVKTVTTTMPEGDYALKGSEGCCLIERKGSLDELASNLLSDDYTRALAAFERLVGTTHNPYLLVECTPGELRRETRWTKQPERIVDALAALIQRLKLRLLLCGQCKTPAQKRTVGELVLRLMLAHSYPQEVDYSGVEESIENISGRLGSAVRTKHGSVRPAGTRTPGGENNETQ